MAIIQGDLNVWIRMISDTVDTEYIQSSLFYVYIIVSVYASKKAMRAILLIYPICTVYFHIYDVISTVYECMGNMKTTRYSDNHVSPSYLVLFIRMVLLIFGHVFIVPYT